MLIKLYHDNLAATDCVKQLRQITGTGDLGVKMKSQILSAIERLVTERLHDILLEVKQKFTLIIVDENRLPLYLPTIFNKIDKNDCFFIKQTQKNDINLNKKAHIMTHRTSCHYAGFNRQQAPSLCLMMVSRQLIEGCLNIIITTARFILIINTCFKVHVFTTLIITTFTHIGYSNNIGLTWTHNRNG